jgi:hypothetical protein
MGLLYLVFALTPEVIDWLTAEGVSFDADRPSRAVTPRDLRVALGTLPDVHVVSEVSEASRWSARVEVSGGEPWTQAHLGDVRGEDDECSLCFEKGWPDLIVRIVEKLCHACGSLVLFCDGGSKPLVITAGADVDEVWAEWRVAPRS